MALTDKLVAIGDAIREKTNTTEKLTLAQMPEMISSITGGEKETEPMITFYDWDGTILHQYPRKDFESMNALPVPPNELEGHTCDGWNYSLETIKFMTGSVNVCTMYRQNDEPEEESEPAEPSYVDGTKLYLDIPADMEVTLYYRQSITNGVTVNWGDEESSTGEGYGTTTITLSHAYKKGTYIVTFDITDGCTLTLGGNNSVLGNNSTSNYYRLGTLKKAEVDLRNTNLNAYAFRSCIGMKEIVIGDGTSQALPTYAFDGNYVLKSVKLSNSITSIGSDCFYRCYSLKTILIPETVTSIGNQAFLDCRSLKTVTIPKNVTYVYSQAFQGCYALKEAILKNGVKNLYSSAFASCYSLRKIKIPNSVINIGSSCFSNCRSLESVILPGNPKTVYSTSVFSYCYALKRVVIPNTIETILDSFFSGCNLKFVGLPKSVKTVNASAFGSNQALRNISIGENVETLKQAFTSCNAVEKIIIPPSVSSIITPVFSQCSCLKEVSLPESMDLGSGIFSNCTFDSLIFRKRTLESFESKENIPAYGFSGTPLLEDITVKGNVGIYGISDSYVLREVKFYDAVENIGDYAFQNDYALEKIAFPVTLGKIGAVAFGSCKSLEEVVFPETQISNQSFYQCYGLEKIRFEGNINITGAAFSNCFSLETVEIADNVEAAKISGGAFSGTSLEAVPDFPENAEITLSSLFSNCYALSEAILSKAKLSNTSTASAFYYCYSLEKVTLPSTNIRASLDRTFYSCYALPEIYLPENIVSLGYGTFSGCYALEKVDIAEKGLESILNEAFSSCYSLREIKIPRSVTLMYYNAFIYCYNLADIYLYPLTPPDVQNGPNYLVANNFPPYYKIRVPKGHIEEYREKWNGFDYGDHMAEFEYIQTRSTTAKKIIAFSAASLVIRDMFAHSDFEEDQTFAVSCTYTGQNLENITGTYDWKADTITLNFRKTNNVMYNKWEDIEISVSADGKEDLNASFTLQAKCIDRDITFEYTVTNISSPYGFVLLDDGYYQSNNQNVNNSYSLCRVDFTTNAEKLFVDCVGGGEANYDFGILSKIDTALSSSNSVDNSTLVQKSFYGNASYDQTVEYDVPDAEPHFIYIKYRKDSSSSVGMDCLKFKLKTEEEQED